MSLYFWCYELELQVNSEYKLLYYIRKKTSREKFSSNGVLWFVIPLIQIHVDTFGPF